MGIPFYRPSPNNNGLGVNPNVAYFKKKTDS